MGTEWEEENKNYAGVQKKKKSVVRKKVWSAKQKPRKFDCT